jgi:hypothetical protein
MPSFVIERFRLPHFPEYFDPTLAEAAQGAGVGLTALAVVLVVGLGLGAVQPRTVGPKVDGRTKEWLAGAPPPVFFDLTGLKGDWGGARVGLQTIGSLEPGAAITDLGEKARCQLDPSTG